MFHPDSNISLCTAHPSELSVLTLGEKQVPSSFHLAGKSFKCVIPSLSLITYVDFFFQVRPPPFSRLSAALAPASPPLRPAPPLFYKRSVEMQPVSPAIFFSPIRVFPFQCNHNKSLSSEVFCAEAFIFFFGGFLSP